MTVSNLPKWEHGSEFFWIPASEKTIVVEHCAWARGAYFGSGRDAIRALLRWGMASRGWNRLFVPSYFCAEVVDSVRSIGIRTASYIGRPDGGRPPLDQLGLHEGDVVFIVNFFGLMSSPLSHDGKRTYDVIEDHTHDPWSVWAESSSADWCIASLRKVLPIPDGGVVWSPRAYDLPRQLPLTPGRRQASLEKMGGMILKLQYLSGTPIPKKMYRDLLSSGEVHVSDSDVSGISPWSSLLLRSYPSQEWRQARKRNYLTFVTEMEDMEWISVLKPDDVTRAYPFSCVLVFDTPERRDYVRRQLILHRVYPAVLWPLDVGMPGVHKEDAMFSARMLSIHCDFRYESSDMIKVASLIKRYGSGS